MNSPYRLRNPSTMIRAGLVFLILFNLSSYFLGSRAVVSEGLADGMTGLLFGISAGLLLLGIKVKRDSGPGPANGQ